MPPINLPMRAYALTGTLLTIAAIVLLVAVLGGGAYLMLVP